MADLAENTAHGSEYRFGRIGEKGAAEFIGHQHAVYAAILQRL